MKIKNNFLVVSNYNNDISWVPRYSDNYLIYDQSEKSDYPETINRKKIIKNDHLGHNIRDYCTFIIDNYKNLPKMVIFATGNIFPRHVSKEYFEKVMNNNFFTPIMDYKKHKESWPKAFFSSDGIYSESNNSWYLNKSHPTKYFHNYNDFLNFCFVSPLIPRYITFATGANYIVPRENILKLPKIFYENLKTFVSHCTYAIPGESHIIERSLHTIWNCNFELNEKMLKPIDKNFIAIPSRKIKNNNNFFTKRLFVKVKIVVKKIFNLFNNTLKYINSKLFQDKILNYRKKIKIYDIFTFFNELELLEIRLNILDKYVDYFVIIEATETFSGLPKKLYFEENKHLFKKYKHKIIHYITNDAPKDEADLRKKLQDNKLNDLDREIINNALTSSNVPKGQIHWLKEFYQKESIKKALVNLSDNDICFISDVDEIWNPKIKIDYSKNDIFKLRQLVYAYFFNNRSDELWAGTLVTKYKNIKNRCLNHLRTASKTKYTYIKNGGWHFTNQGGPDQIRKKIESYGHQEFNNNKIKSQIENKILNNQDFIGRNFNFWTDERDLPEYILNNKNRYKNLFCVNQFKKKINIKKWLYKKIKKIKF